MRIQRPFARALSGVVLTAFVAGCSGNDSVSSIQAAPNYGALSQRNKIVWPKTVPTIPELNCNSLPNILHVSQFNNNTVKIYNNPQNQGNPPPLITITASQGLNGPAGMIVGPAGTVLYVANYNAQNVLLFKKCGTGPGAKMIDAPNNPVDVAVDSASPPNVYVSNFTAPSVTVFPAGSLNYNPSLTLSDSTARSGAGITIDSSGNCFWSFQDISGQGRVDEFINCAMPGISLALVPTIKIAAGVQLDFPANRLLLNDTAVGKTYRIPPPYNTAPFTFPLSSQPIFLTLRGNEQRLYVADAGGMVRRYTYPAGNAQASITNGLTATGKVTGVAVWPPAPL